MILMTIKMILINLKMKNQKNKIIVMVIKVMKINMSPSLYADLRPGEIERFTEVKSMGALTSKYRVVFGFTFVLEAPNQQ